LIQEANTVVHIYEQYEIRLSYCQKLTQVSLGNSHYCGGYLCDTEKYSIAHHIKICSIRITMNKQSDSIDSSAKALVEFWDWAAEKGQMNPNSARALKAACVQTLAIEDGWQSLDVRNIDPEDLSRRFQNKRSKDFTPASLEAYRQRFAKAVRLFLEYVKAPAAWKHRPALRSPKIPKKNGATLPKDRVETPGIASPAPGFVDFAFPIRPPHVAHLVLPTDLKLAEVRRLTAYLSTLAVDFNPAKVGSINE
jgi:hypothetical protein